MTRRYIRDLAERVISTYAQAFLGLLLASGFGVDGVLDLSIAVKAAVAAIPAALSVLKGLLARSVGDKESASLAVPPVAGP
ncbi:MAG: holin [Chloroflexi bacterium]|nr:holin [Chloroflexota bacterium]